MQNDPRCCYKVLQHEGERTSLHAHLEHGGKYQAHGGVRGLRDAEDVEVPHEAGSDFAAPPPRGSGTRDKHRVRYLLPEQFVAIVEDLFIKTRAAKENVLS